ncbi:hypothetical protein SLS62_006120 [Diatrype stigma]|uniref:FAD dependent oxidoreductase domain-containing protein n=1 Tax=Diatrype stigma TaxID=117547 RepID=A0AAN9URZ2_9PEZI
MLRAVIVGGGIAGLSTAIALRRAGHAVVVYERTQLDNEVGAAINVPPNASRFLVGDWGLDPARSRFVRATRLTWHDPVTAAPLSGATLSHARNAERFGADLWLAHRVDLHASLRRLATEPGAGPGVPVVPYPGSKVVGYDPHVPSITLASGEVVEADVVIAADGVHSTASSFVLGYTNHPVTPSHYNYCYRFLIPASVLEADPKTRFWNEGTDGRTRIFADNEGQRRLVAYVCRE